MAPLVSAKSIGGIRVCRDTTFLLPKALPKATFGWFFIVSLRDEFVVRLPIFKLWVMPNVYLIIWVGRGNGCNYRFYCDALRYLQGLHKLSTFLILKRYLRQYWVSLKKFAKLWIAYMGVDCCSSNICIVCGNHWSLIHITNDSDYFLRHISVPRLRARSYSAELRIH